MMDSALLKENDEFHSWEEWKSRFEEWCQATSQQYKVNTSRTVAAYNKGRDVATQKRDQSKSTALGKSQPELAPKVEEKWQFVYVRYLCVHNNRAKSGHTPNPKTPPKNIRNCKATVVVKYERKVDCIIVLKLDPVHDHTERTPDIQQPSTPMAPASLIQDEVVEDSLEGASAYSGVQDIVETETIGMNPLDPEDLDETGAHPSPVLGMGLGMGIGDEEVDADEDLGPQEEYRALTLKGIMELPGKLTLLGDPGPVQVLLQELQKLEECDQESRSSIIVNNQSELVAVFFQTGHMKRKFALYPEILLFDAGYHFAMNPEYSLVSFSGHDAQGLGGPFAFAILMKPIRLMAGLLLNVFIQHNQPASRNVRCILLDREQHRRLKNQLPTLFEGARCVLYCHFHVVRSMLKEMTRIDLPLPMQERICKTLRGMFSGLQEKNYNEHLKKLDGIETRFAKYFNTQWHLAREMWAGFRREGVVPFANGMNDRVEVLSQFMSLVCERSQTLSDALCNLVYAVTGIIEQTNTDRLLCDIREYHMKMVEHEARLISLCCDYAALHVLTQVRISRTYKFSVTQTLNESTYLVSSVGGKGTVQPGRNFSCSCAFQQTYQLPCSHAFVVAIAHTIPMQDCLIPDKWRRTEPFPVDIMSDLSEGPGSGMKYCDKLAKMREITNGLATLAAVSNQADFNNMFAIINQIYTAWTRNTGHRVQVSITPPVVSKSGVSVGTLEDEEDMDITNGATKHLNDDPSLNSTSSVGVKVSTNSASSVTMKLPPDDTVFGFTGSHLGAEEHLEEYGDLNCFTAPSGGPVESTGNMNLFEDLPAGGRENSPVLLSIKDEEDSKDDCDGTKGLKWDNVENYKLLDSIIGGDINMDEPDK